MSSPENFSVSEGSCPGVFELPWPWPPQNTIRALSRRLQDGCIALDIEVTGKMGVRLIKDGDAPREIMSCPLYQPTHTATTFCIIWKGSKLDLYLNNTLVASAEDKIPDRYEFPPPNLSRPMHDFSEENERARECRRHTMAGTHPRRGRERADNDYIFGGLSDAIIQVKDQLEHIKRGELAYASGLSSQIRKLIADKKQPAGGLLQWCAAVIDEPLIIYTAANPRLRLPKDVGPPVDNVKFTASATARLLTRNPVDLDVWLKLPTAQIGGQVFNNHEVIHNVASTIDSHFDVDKHPLVGALRSTSSRMGSLSGDIDFLVDFMRRVAEVVVGLSEKVIAKKPSR
jgi:hypothetical protein